MKRYEKVTNELTEFFYNGRIEPFSMQKKGCSADYIVDGLYCLEVKYDRRAHETGNIFIEYATEFNKEETLSGISLSAYNGYTVLYLLPEPSKVKAYEIPAKTLLALAKEHGKKVKTQPHANGNRLNFYGLGYKLSIDYIKGYYLGEVENK